MHQSPMRLISELKRGSGRRLSHSGPTLSRDAKADTEPDKKPYGQLTATEWLTYAEKRVPALYEEIKNGKHKLIVNGKPVEPGTKDSTGVIIGTPSSAANKNGYQQPTLFDFKKRRVNVSFPSMSQV